MNNTQKNLNQAYQNKIVNNKIKNHDLNINYLMGKKKTELIIINFHFAP